MKKTFKRFLAIFLILLLTVPFVGGIAALAAPPNQTVVRFDPDPINKTVRLQCDLSHLGTDSVSLIIMNPAFTGGAGDIWSNDAKIVALEQVDLQSGVMNTTVTLGSIELEKNYSVFINGDSVTGTFRFVIRKYSVNAGETIALPIILEDCNGFAGVKAVLDYDSDLLTLNSIGAKSGFILQAGGDSFIAASEDGMGLNGTVEVGYALFTAKANLEDDITAYVTLPKEKVRALNQSGAETEVTLPLSEVTIVAEPPLRGDVNLDGEVTLADAILALQYISKNITLTNRQYKAADATGDGIVNTADAIVIMQMCL